MNKRVQEKLDNFFNQFSFKTYKKGEIIILADSNPSGVFYIKEGIVKKYAISKKGEDLVVNIYRENSFFPLSWAINNSPNKYFYEAMTQVKAWRAPKEEVVKFLRNENDILFDLISRVYKGTDGLLMRIQYLMSGSAYSRLITELLICAKRFGARDKITGVTVFKIAEKDLAAQTGLTFETVSREIKNLKNRNLIKYSRGVLSIENMEKLEGELSKDFSTQSS